MKKQKKDRWSVSSLDWEIDERHALAMERTFVELPGGKTKLVKKRRGGERRYSLRIELEPRDLAKREPVPVAEQLVKFDDHAIFYRSKPGVLASFGLEKPGDRLIAASFGPHGPRILCTAKRGTFVR